MTNKTAKVLVRIEPDSISVPKFKTLDTMKENEFNEIIKKGLEQAENGEYSSLDNAFNEIMEDLK